MLKHNIKMMMNSKYMTYYGIIRDMRKSPYFSKNWLEYVFRFSDILDAVVNTLCYVDELTMDEFREIQKYRSFLVNRLEEKFD